MGNAEFIASTVGTGFWGSGFGSEFFRVLGFGFDVSVAEFGVRHVRVEGLVLASATIACSQQSPKPFNP